MKVWNALFNIIGVLIVAFMILVINNLEDVNKRNFEELRLAQAIDYANEGAFRTVVESDSIGTDYTDGGLEEIKINPSGVVDAFANIMCLSYDIAPSEENIDYVKQSIVTGVMCAVDGYYILEEFEIDNDPMDSVIGGEFELKWGIKRPYIVYATDNSGEERMYAVNLVNEKSIEYLPKSEQSDYSEPFTLGEALVYRMTYAANTGEDADFMEGRGKGAVAFYDETLGKTEAQKQAWAYSRSEIGKLLTKDIAIAVNARNIRSRGTTVKQFYMPSVYSFTGISHIKSPTLILIFQDSTFLNGYDLDAVSVGGHRVKVASKVIGFEIAGEKYYCFAGQQLKKDGVTKEDGVGDERLFKNTHEAAKAGYKPHMAFLKKSYGAANDE